MGLKSRKKAIARGKLRLAMNRNSNAREGNQSGRVLKKINWDRRSSITIF